MTTLDDIQTLFDPADGPRPGAAPARKCKHPRDQRVSVHWCTDGTGFWHFDRVDDGTNCEPGIICALCYRRMDAAASKRGRTNRKRGLSIQREVAAALEMEHIPGNGPADARDPRFVAEVKSGPSWYSVRVEAELDNLPTTGDRLPIFVAASTPGPGKGRRRTYGQVSLGDLVKMVGPHVQVAMWAPEWVALKHITEGGTE